MYIVRMMAVRLLLMLRGRALTAQARSPGFTIPLHTPHVELDLTCQLQAAVEHWLRKPGALCSTLDNCQLFTWLYFHNIKTFSSILCQAERKWFCFIGNTIVSSFSLIMTICRCCQRLSTIPLEGGTLTRGLWTTLQQSSKNGTRLTHLPSQSSVCV